MFDKVQSELSSARDSFSENVRDAFGASIDSELFEEFLNTVVFCESCSKAADVKEGVINAMLIELRLIL